MNPDQRLSLWLRILQALRSKLQGPSLGKSIGRALALHKRGEVRHDGLDLITFANTLKICWRAREVHPWDRNLSPEETIRAFNEQSISDTEAAVTRLFRAIPQVDTIELCVIHPLTKTPLMEGTVSRSSLLDMRTFNLRSSRMRLLQLGLRCYLPETMRITDCDGDAKFLPGN